MPIPLPESMEAQADDSREIELTPQEIVAELDKFIIGQKPAKKAVAIALRNRFRRRKLPPDLADEIAPKNILMIGPTGVGKTEISRRLAKLTSSPFLKIEASKFTEVGYVGRDVESMIRDLVRISVDMVKSEKIEEIEEKAKGNVEERILDLLLPAQRRREGAPGDDDGQRFQETREKLRKQLRDGFLEDRAVEIEVKDKTAAPFEVFSNSGVEEIGIQLQELIPGFMGGKSKKRKMKIKEAREILLEDEEKRLVDMDQVSRLAIERVEHSGIIFLDEVDKIAGRETGQGPEVSREGVQRDLLPIIEGTTVNTRFGLVHTDHVLFIGAGAFHKVKPSDLVPELQGRLPLRVELDSLGEEDLFRILQEPESSLVGQYQALLGVEGVVLRFEEEALREVASFAARMNAEMENIGARRLQTILELLLEEISFDAHARRGETVVVDASLVRRRLEGVISDGDLRKYLL